MKNWNDMYNELQPIECRMIDNFEALLKNLKPQRILEIGTGWGVSLRTFTRFAPTAKIITIDTIPPEDRKGYVDRMDGFKENVREIIGDSKKFVPQLEGTFDLIYIDGSHDYADVLADLKNSLAKITPGGTIIMDDLLHPHNDTDYGVLKAFREVLFENIDKEWHVSIMLVAYGQALITV